MYILKTVIKLCYMNWHLVKLYAMKIKCKTFVIPLSIFQNVYRYLSLFVKMAHKMLFQIHSFIVDMDVELLFNFFLLDIK